MNTSRPKSQTPKAKVNKPKQKQPTGKVKKTGKGKKRQKPIVISRTLESKNSVRFKDNGDTLDILMDVLPQKIDGKDDVYFSISLATDTDSNFSDSALEFVAISIDGDNVPIPKFVDIEKDGCIVQEPADQTQIKLGKLLQLQNYRVMATVKKPKKVEKISVALKPFLGLKQSKGSES